MVHCIDQERIQGFVDVVRIYTEAIKVERRPSGSELLGSKCLARSGTTSPSLREAMSYFMIMQARWSASGHHHLLRRPHISGRECLCN